MYKCFLAVCHITARDRALFLVSDTISFCSSLQPKKNNELEKKKKTDFSKALAIMQLASMQNFLIPNLYAIRYYCMKCNKGQQNLCHCIWIDLLNVHAENVRSSHRFLRVKDPVASPRLAFAVLSCQCRLVRCDRSVVFFGPSIRSLLNITLFWCAKAVFGFSTAAYT